MRNLFTILLLILTITCSSQTYISLMPTFSTSQGTVAQRAGVALEVGKQLGPFSIGFDLGKTSLSNNDTTTYLEVRPNLNIFQQDKFTNTLTIGMGYVLRAEENVMTELSTGIEYTPNKRFSYNIFFGTCYYSGVHSNSNENYLAMSVMYYLKY